jgi:HTH-type transcriptional regulator/antitoxin HipB
MGTSSDEGEESALVRATDWSDPDVVGRFVARARRMADLSQRGLARAVGTPHSAIGQFEAGTRMPSLPLLAEILATAGLHLVIVDERAMQVHPIAADGVRDDAGRRFPIHHDIGTVLDPPSWVPHADWRHDQDPAARWGVRGRERDERRERTGAEEARREGDHPNERMIAARVALARRYPRISVRTPPSPPVECLCFDECFERLCLEDCPCQCE